MSATPLAGIDKAAADEAPSTAAAAAAAAAADSTTVLTASQNRQASKPPHGTSGKAPSSGKGVTSVKTGSSKKPAIGSKRAGAHGGGVTPAPVPEVTSQQPSMRSYFRITAPRPGHNSSAALVSAASTASKLDHDLAAAAGAAASQAAAGAAASQAAAATAPTPTTAAGAFKNTTEAASVEGASAGVKPAGDGGELVTSSANALASALLPEPGQVVPAASASAAASKPPAAAAAAAASGAAAAAAAQQPSSAPVAAPSAEDQPHAAVESRAVTNAATDATDIPAVADATAVAVPAPALPIHPFFTKRVARQFKPADAAEKPDKAVVGTGADKLQQEPAGASAEMLQQAAAAQVAGTALPVTACSEPHVASTTPSQEVGPDLKSEVRKGAAVVADQGDAGTGVVTLQGDSKAQVQAKTAAVAGKRRRGKQAKKSVAGSDHAAGEAAQGRKGKNAGAVSKQTGLEHEGGSSYDIATQHLNVQEAAPALASNDMGSKDVPVSGSGTVTGSDKAASEVAAASQGTSADASCPPAKKSRETSLAAVLEAMRHGEACTSDDGMTTVETISSGHQVQLNNDNQAAAGVLSGPVAADQQQEKQGQQQGTGSCAPAEDDNNDVVMIHVEPSEQHRIQAALEATGVVGSNDAKEGASIPGSAAVWQATAIPNTRRRRARQQQRQEEEEEQRQQAVDATLSCKQPALQNDGSQVQPRKGQGRRKREEASPPVPRRSRSRKQAGTGEVKVEGSEQVLLEPGGKGPGETSKPELIDVTKDEELPAPPVTIDLVSPKQPSAVVPPGPLEILSTQAPAADMQQNPSAGDAAPTLVQEQNGSKQRAAVCMMFLPVAERKRLKQLELAEAKWKKQEEEDAKQQQQQQQLQASKDELKCEAGPAEVAADHEQPTDKDLNQPAARNPVNPFFQARRPATNTARAADGTADDVRPATPVLNSWVTRSMGLALAPVHVMQHDNSSSSSNLMAKPQHSTIKLADLMTHAANVAEPQPRAGASLECQGSSPGARPSNAGTVHKGQAIFSLLAPCSNMRTDQPLGKGHAVPCTNTHTDQPFDSGRAMHAAPAFMGRHDAVVDTTADAVVDTTADAVMITTQPDLLTQLACSMAAADAPGQSMTQLLALPSTQEHLAGLLASLQDVLQAQQQAVGSSMDAGALGSSYAATVPPAVEVQPIAPAPICIDLSAVDDKQGINKAAMKDVVDLNEDPAAPAGSTIENSLDNNDAAHAQNNSLAAPASAAVQYDGAVKSKAMVAEAWQTIANSMLWQLRFQPNKVDQICGNQGPAAELKSWLDGWKASIETLAQKQAQAAPQREHSWLVSDDSGLFDEDGNSLLGGDAAGSSTGCTNAILLTGPPGCGKTAAVYATAQELGYAVMEVNAGTDRDGRFLTRMFGEATRSKQLAQHGKSWAGPGGASAPAATVAKPTTFMGLFAGAFAKTGAAVTKAAGGKDEKGSQAGVAGMRDRQAGQSGSGRHRAAGTKRRKGRGNKMDSSDGGSNSSTEPEYSDSSEDRRGKRRGSKAKRGRSNGTAGRGKGRGAKASPVKQAAGPHHKQQLLQVQVHAQPPATATDTDVLMVGAGHGQAGTTGAKEEQQPAGPEVGAVHLRALSVILFEDADVLQDEDVGFIKVLGDLIQATKKPIVLCTNSDSAPPGLAQLRLKQIRFHAPSYQQLLRTACLATAAAGLGSHISLLQVQKLLRDCLSEQGSRQQVDIRRCLQHLQLQLMGEAGAMGQQPDQLAVVKSFQSFQAGTHGQQAGTYGQQAGTYGQQGGTGAQQGCTGAQQGAHASDAGPFSTTQQAQASITEPAQNPLQQQVPASLVPCEHGPQDLSTAQTQWSGGSSTWSYLARTEQFILTAACARHSDSTLPVMFDSTATMLAPAASMHTGADSLCQQMEASRQLHTDSWKPVLPPMPPVLFSAAAGLQLPNSQAVPSASCPAFEQEHVQHGACAGGNAIQGSLQRQELLAEYATACEVAQQRHIAATWRAFISQQAGSFFKPKSSRAGSTRGGRRGGRAARTPHSASAPPLGMAPMDTPTDMGTDTEQVGQVAVTTKGRDAAGILSQGMALAADMGEGNRDMNVQLLEDTDSDMDAVDEQLPGLAAGTDTAVAKAQEAEGTKQPGTTHRRLRRLQAVTDSSTDDGRDELDDELEDVDMAEVGVQAQQPELCGVQHADLNSAEQDRGRAELPAAADGGSGAVEPVASEAGQCQAQPQHLLAAGEPDVVQPGTQSDVVQPSTQSGMLTEAQDMQQAPHCSRQTGMDAINIQQQIAPDAPRPEGSQQPRRYSLSQPASLLQSPMMRVAMATPVVVAQTPGEHPTQQIKARRASCAASTPALQVPASTPATQQACISIASGLLATPAEQLPAVGQPGSDLPVELVLPPAPPLPPYSFPFLRLTPTAGTVANDTIKEATATVATDDKLTPPSAAPANVQQEGASNVQAEHTAGAGDAVRDYLQSQPECCSMSALAACCEFISMAEVLSMPQDPVPPISRCAGPSHSMSLSCAKPLQAGMNLGIACSETARPFPQPAPALVTSQTLSTGQPAVLHVRACLSTFDGSDVSAAIHDQLWHECVGLDSAEPAPTCQLPDHCGSTIPQEAALQILHTVRNSSLVNNLLQQGSAQLLQREPAQLGSLQREHAQLGLLQREHAQLGLLQGGQQPKAESSLGDKPGPVQLLPGWGPKPEMVVAANDAILYSSLLACSQDHNKAAAVERVASLGRICRLEVQRLHMAQRSLTGRALRAARTQHALSLFTSIPEHLFPTLAHIATFGSDQ